MKTYTVTGFYYTQSAINFLLAQGMAAYNEDDDLEIYTQPTEWDERYPFHPDLFSLYHQDHRVHSIAEIYDAIQPFPWVEQPTIEPYNESLANHLLMKAIGHPMLPGLEPKEGL